MCSSDLPLSQGRCLLQPLREDEQNLLGVVPRLVCVLCSLEHLPEVLHDLRGGQRQVEEEAVVAERIDGSSIYCGAWGEFKGIAGFTSANNAGLKLEYVGPREDENAYQYRMKWYCGFDLYNRLALARMAEVLPLTA